MRPTAGETICGRVRIDADAPPLAGAHAFGPPLTAHMLDDGKPLWLTVIERDLVPTAVDLSRFMAGAHGLLELRHPGLVRVELVDREADFCVVGCAPVDAEPLPAVLDRGGGPALAQRAAVDMARALAQLHGAGRVHGVLAPGNVLVARGAPLLAQHGIAQLCDPKRFAARARKLGGDLVAPEVDGAHKLAPAVDVYAWGAVVSAMLTGLDGADAVAAVMTGEAGKGALVQVVQQALAPDPRTRITDAVELLRRLDASRPAAGRSMPTPTPRSPLPPERAREGFVPLEDLHLGTVEEHAPRPEPAAPVIAADERDESDPFGSLELEDEAPLLTVPADTPDDEWDFERGGDDRLVAFGAQGSAAAPPPEEEDEFADTFIVDEPLPSARRPPLPAARPPSAAASPPAARPPSAAASPPAARTRGAGPPAAPLRSARPPAPSSSRPPSAAPLPDLDDGMPSISADEEVDPFGPPVVAPTPTRAPDPPRPAAAPGSPAAPDLAMPGITEDDEDALLEPEPPPLPPRTVAHAPPAPAAPEPAIALAMPTASEARLALDRPGTDAPADVAQAGASSSLALPLPKGHAPGPAHPAESYGGFGREPLPLELDLPSPATPPSAATAAAARSVAPGPAVAGRGPKGTGMAAVVWVVATLLAVGLTLPVAQHRGGLSALLGLADPIDAEAIAPEPRGTDDAPPPSDAKTPTDPAPVVSGKCPADTVRNGATGDAITCIDAGEYPGLREIPRVDVSLADARSLCAERGRRLCSAAEWRRACAGASGRSFPYGDRHRADTCNEARPDGSGANLSRSGARDGCRSEIGAFDLVGNVGEWVEEGIVLGGDATTRTPTCATKVDARPSSKSPSTGFRCCVDVPIP